MTIQEYQEQAHTFAVYPSHDWFNYCRLGLLSEVGEVAGVLKKQIRGDGLSTEEFQARLSSEMGDVLWYIAEMATRKDHMLQVPAHPPRCTFGMLATHVGLLQGPVSYSSGEPWWLFRWFLGTVDDFQLYFPDVMEKNIAKLSQRRTYGTIKGDGDSR